MPVLFLMFFVRSTSQQNNSPKRNACPKCASAHSPGQNFCTKCGWDLSHDYSPEGGDTVLASEMRQPQAASTATIERPSEAAPAETSAPAAEAPPAVETEATHTAGATGAVTQPAGEAVGNAEPDGNPAAPEEEPSPEPAYRPWGGTPQPGAAPTAEVMTARGAMMVSEGRLQEAIDQFTKAIALNPKHREAFERRAEAYTRQGRGERAEEDYRHIQALNTSL